MAAIEQYVAAHPEVTGEIERPRAAAAGLAASDALAPSRDVRRPPPMTRWFGSDMPTDLVLVIHSFETWTHTDDIRRSIGRPLATPSAAALHTMAASSMTMFPSALESSGRMRPGRTARVVLDVSLTLPVVDWCRRFSDGLTADDLDMLVHGDRRLGANLVGAAPVFASL